MNDVCPDCRRPVETHSMFDPPRCPVIHMTWDIPDCECGSGNAAGFWTGDGWMCADCYAEREAEIRQSDV